MQDTDSEDDDDLAEQVWDDIDLKEIARDLDETFTTVPLSAPCRSSMSTATNFLKWLLGSVLFIQCMHVVSDSCVSHFLLLLKMMFDIVSPHSTFCGAVGVVLPGTLYSLRKFLKFDRDDFEKYIVCQNCLCLYKY